MPSQIPPRQPGAASALGPTPTEASNDATTLPRRLVVEVYAPPVARASNPKACREAVRRGWISRDVGRNGLVVVLVIALHVALGSWLLINSGKTDLLRAAVLPPLELQPAIQAAPTHVSHVDVPADLSSASIASLPIQVPTLPRLGAIEAAPPEMAISISPATDVVITTANSAESAIVARRCLARRSISGPPARSFRDMSILIRVEPDGRVSDTRVETGSGDARADVDAQRCLTDYGAFPPSRSQGHAIASWQRLRWAAGGIDQST